MLLSWPEDLPLAAHIAGDPQRTPGFSLFARPEAIYKPDTLDELAALIRSSHSCIQRAHPFGPGWLVSIDYSAGHEIEPSASVAGGAANRVVATAARVESGYAIDNRSGQVFSFGSPPETAADAGAGFVIGSAHGLDRRTLYTGAVARAIELIRAGDVFQVNLTHRLHAEFAGSTRALMSSLVRSLRPWHGFYLEAPAESPTDIAAIASLSPELFLELSEDGSVRTRPMKGTRPGSTPIDELMLADKDRAELAMIVDLMRNDLGRVCEIGSVRVTEDRTIEPHGGTADQPSLWQGVATVEGRLRANADVVDLIRACFPPGSITGAPKVRAMQIIDELEPVARVRRLDCRDAAPTAARAAIIGDDGSASLNVAIRTAIVTGASAGTGVVQNGSVHYPVGAGIVADSDPACEWQETLDKARPFLELCESGGEPG